MPGENLQDWSTTAASNSNSDSSINWAEGQTRDSVNNSARAMMAAHAKDRNLHNGSIVTAGTANAQTFFSGLNYTAGTMPTGLRVLLKIGPTLTNTAAATLNMDGIGAVAIKDPLAADLVAGALTADAYAELVYNGTNWILLVGNITALSNALLAARSMFRADKTVLQAGFVAVTPAQISFDTAAINIGSNFATSSWNPPAGRVLLGATLFLQTADATGCIVTLQFRKNGVTIIGSVAAVLAAGDILGGTTIVGADVAAGSDIYTVWASFDRGGTVHPGQFFGMLM